MSPAAGTLAARAARQTEAGLGGASESTGTDRESAPVEASGPGAASSSAITALEQQLALLFASARTLMRERAEAVHPELTAGSFTVLTSLVRSGPQHAGALASTLSVDKSVMSRIVKQLIDLDLAERRPDPADGRAYFIAATPAAVRNVDAMRDEHRAALRRFLADWPDPDIAQLTALLARLNGVV